jgi:hypothetical protein
MANGAVKNKIFGIEYGTDTASGRCPRCGGLMVADFCMDLLNSTGELECSASRCVQCGEIVDPVILRNRLYLKELSPAAFAVTATVHHNGRRSS